MSLRGKLSGPIVWLLIVAVAGAIVLWTPATVRADATVWNRGGLRVTTRPGPNDSALSVPDGVGGSIIALVNARGGISDIIAQRVDSRGQIRWGSQGTAIRTVNPTEAPFMRIVADGFGGAIISWRDFRAGNWDVYAQRVSPDGKIRWKPKGAAVCALKSHQDYPRLAPDGSGGAVFCWDDYRAGSSNRDIYAQRITASGARAWGSSGVAVCTAPGDQIYPRVVSDGRGGGIVTWNDARAGNWDVYAQRVTRAGKAAWTAGGVAVCAAANSQWYPYIAAVGSGASVIAWEDTRSGQSHIYAQMLDSGGKRAWAAHGVAVCNLDGSFLNGALGEGSVCADGEGGSIIAWRGRISEVRAQKMVSSGLGRWPVNGVMVARRAALMQPTVAPDGTGGGFFTWVLLSANGIGVEAQSVTAAGKRRWGSGGLTIDDSESAERRTNFENAAVSPCGSGAAVVTWNAERGGKQEVFAQKVSLYSLDRSWYLAEGTTAWGFETYISILNPNDSEVSARITYMTDRGAEPGGEVYLAGRSQLTVRPREVLGEKDFSATVTCVQGKGISVDRTMYWTGPGAASPEGHSSIGVTAPDYSWYLPEGSSNWGFETFLLVQNPGSAEATCEITYMIEGEGPRSFSRKVPGRARRTYNMAEEIGGEDASIMVSSDRPVIAERAMYKDGRRQGHGSIGAVRPANSYFLAEGTSAWGFTTYVLVQNPHRGEVDVEITYMTDSGPVAHPENPIRMPGGTRKTVRVNDFLAGRDFSTEVQGSGTIIAERAMYWDAGLGEACHASIGTAAPHHNFFLPDGQCGGGYETWTLVQNPNPGDVSVEISYLSAEGANNKSFTAVIPAGSRRTFDMSEQYPGRSVRAGTVVKARSAAPGNRIIVERAMYWNSRGAGTDTIGGFSD
jgi:hypothetical protein